MTEMVVQAEAEAAGFDSGRRGGLIWTPYGAPAYERLAAAVAGAKATDPLAPVTVLVPTNLCGVVARRHLARGVGGRGGVVGLTVATIDRLAERIAAPALVGGGRRPTTGPVLAAAWRQILTEDAGVFDPVARNPGMVRALVAAHRELREVDDDGLAAIEARGGRVARDMVRLHRRVCGRLDGGFYDVADLRREAAAIVGGSPTVGREVGTVVVFLPQDLRPGAVRVLTALRSIVELHVIAGVTGEARADAAVLHSVRRLGGTTRPPTGTPSTAERVLHASDADDEVRCVVREVMTTLRSVPAHRIAVLYGSARPYARLLAEQFAAAGLARNGAGVRPTIERTLPRLLLDLLALPDHHWRRDEVLAVIARATVRVNDRRPPARWERLSREAGVVAGDDWQTRLAAHARDLRDTTPADATEAQRRGREYEATSADELRAFVATLRAHVDPGARMRSWSELASWGAAAFDLVTGDLERVARLPEEEAWAAEKVRLTLAGLTGLAAIEETADVDALRGTLEQELSDDLPRYGRFGQGVLVAPLSESVGLDAEVVFAVGLADDLVPGRLDADALLSEEVRALTGGQLAPPRERIDRQHRHLLAAIAAAPRCVASFPRGDLRRSTMRVPSRWLRPTFRRIAGPAGADPGGWQRVVGPALAGSPSFAAGLATATEWVTGQEWRTRAAAAGAGQGRDLGEVLPGDGVLARALELARARRSAALTRFDGDLRGHDTPSPAGSALTSPTALEQWVRCPHAYFVDRLLGVRPVDSPEHIIQVSALDIGSIVHEALDEFHRSHGDIRPDQNWTAGQRAALHDITRSIAARFTARGLTGHPLLWERELIRILTHLDRLLDDDNQVRAETGRRQVRSELPFGLRGEPPVRLSLPSGLVINLRGSADRVDLAGDSIVVVDYKTGSPKSFRDLSETNPTANGSKLQLPVYAKAARAALGEPDAPVSAEYWFVGENISHVSVPLTDEVERIFAEAVDVIVNGIAAGLFPHRPAADDTFGRYIPCRYCDPDGLGAGEHRQRWLSKRTDPRLAAYGALVEPSTAAGTAP
jgi:hypothetical protein